MRSYTGKINFGLESDGKRTDGYNQGMAASFTAAEGDFAVPEVGYVTAWARFMFD